MTSDLTLGQARAEYLQSIKPELRATQDPSIKRFVDFYGETFLLSSLEPGHVERYAEREIQSSDTARGDRIQALKAWFVFLKKKEHTPTNLGVHIRAPRASSRGGGPSRQDEAPIEMTQAGHAALLEELRSLEEQRAEQKLAVEVARSDGDLRENAPYHAAREALALVENRYRTVEQSLRRAVVVEHAAGDRAGVGSVVKVLNLEDEKSVEYCLVSPREANAAERKISIESPVGKELLGKRPGDQVTVSTPRGSVRFRIEAVSGL